MFNLEKYICLFVVSIFYISVVFSSELTIKHVKYSQSQYYSIREDLAGNRDYIDYTCLWMAYFGALKLQSVLQEQNSTEDEIDIEPIVIDYEKDNFFGLPYGNYTDPAIYIAIKNNILINKDKLDFFGAQYLKNKDTNKKKYLKNIVFFKYDVSMAANLGCIKDNAKYFCPDKMKHHNRIVRIVKRLAAESNDVIFSDTQDSMSYYQDFQLSLKRVIECFAINCYTSEYEALLEHINNLHEKDNYVFSIITQSSYLIKSFTSHAIGITIQKKDNNISYFVYDGSNGDKSSILVQRFCVMINNPHFFKKAIELYCEANRYIASSLEEEVVEKDDYTQNKYFYLKEYLPSKKDILFITIIIALIVYYQRDMLKQFGQNFQLST